CILSGTEAIPERHSYKGRSDLEVLTPDFVYVFEFKYNKSLREAMEQIDERDYAGRYATDPRTVFLIGANYVEKKDERRLEYEIKPYK
ncbi:MAG: PD-(D/E)XK nuclease domain-containing protein, partial [Muribaculaceae bacterium]|nr:PD-(D/E)XK nuclease domain-containing protein [Muribaculaceae bacterium]